MKNFTHENNAWNVWLLESIKMPSGQGPLEGDPCLLELLTVREFLIHSALFAHFSTNTEDLGKLVSRYCKSAPAICNSANTDL